MYSSILAASRISTRRVICARSLHASAPYGKTVTEKVKDVADNVLKSSTALFTGSLDPQVNKKVGKGLSDAIGAGQNVAESASETIGSRLVI
jgi:hypothetical protein